MKYLTQTCSAINTYSITSIYNHQNNRSSLAILCSPIEATRGQEIKVVHINTSLKVKIA